MSPSATDALDAIRARHVAVNRRGGRRCLHDGEPWPCDTAHVLAALDDCRGANVNLARDRNAAEAREARLREALTSLADALPYEPGSMLGGKIAIARAALSQEAETREARLREALDTPAPVWLEEYNGVHGWMEAMDSLRAALSPEAET